MDDTFIHLHTHSHYSLLRSTIKLDDLLDRVQEEEMPAVALTDLGNMFGTIDFYKKARKAGIKPIIGAELFVAPGDRREKNPSGSDAENTHITVLARNNTGYTNLIKLVSKGYLEGYYYNPRVDRDLLNRHSDGLICLSGCWHSRFNKHLRVGEAEEARKQAREYREMFGPEDFYIELNRHGRDGEKTVMQSACSIADDLDLPVVATNDVHYLDPEDAFAQQVLRCIEKNRPLSEVTRPALPTDQFHFRSAEEMKELFSDLPEAIENTWKIARRCEVEIDLDHYHLPVYDTERDERQILRNRCEEKLREKYDDITEELKERLEHELETIADMGFSGYFLIVQELVEAARERNIPVGPGRGSAAGCLVGYLLGITGIDPIEHDLLFERFLNPGRHEMPDIDIDFCKARRDELLDWVREKYGEEHTTQIITFNVMKSRQAVRDVARILEIPYEDADEIAEMIEQGQPLKEAWEKNPDLRQFIEKGGDTFQKLWDLSIKVEDLNRNSGKHAAGVVIGDRPLIEYCPVYKSDKGETTQYDGDAVEEIGLLKMDILGLKNLTTIENCLQKIENHTGSRPEMEQTPLEDEPTYDLLRQGHTKGVFQLESEGMAGLCERLHPDHFDDVIALLALYRPGPLDSGMTDQYVARKHGREDVTYPHPELEEILEPTYGVMIYQEQIMQAANKLAGFSLGEADKLRKAMGKKIPELLDKYREKFVNGAVDNGVERETASELFDDIQKFGRYGFNRSHSAAYAMITMQTAYLKANYPLQYMASLMTSSSGNTDKLQEYIEEARNMGIEIRNPHLNRSGAEFWVEEGEAIRYSLAAIKQVGERAAREIVDRRPDDGYDSLFDLCSSVDLQLIDSGCLEALVEAGSLDDLHPSRASTFSSIEMASEYGARQQKNRERGQQSLFGDEEGNSTARPDLKESRSWSREEKLAREKNVFGFYLDRTPLSLHEDILRVLQSHTVNEIKHQQPDDRFRVGGRVTSTSEVRIGQGNHEGEMMLFYSLEGTEGEVIEGVVFPGTLQEYNHRVFEDGVILVEGSLRNNENDLTLETDRVELAERALRSFVKGVEFSLRGITGEQLERLQSILEDHRGDSRLYLKVPTRDEEKVRLRADRRWSIEMSRHLLDDLEPILPREQISITSESVR